MRRRRPEEEQQPDAKRPGATAPPTGILALQQSAGNHAVARLLSREKEAGPEREPPTVHLGDLGVVVLESWNSSGRNPAGGAAPRREVEKEDANLLEIVASGKVGAHSSRLMQHAYNGKVIETAAFENSGLKVTLLDAHVVSYSNYTHEGVEFESWSISGKLK